MINIRIAALTPQGPRQPQERSLEALLAGIVVGWLMIVRTRKGVLLTARVPG
jgi:hypothetical protein